MVWNASYVSGLQKMIWFIWEILNITVNRTFFLRPINPGIYKKKLVFITCKEVLVVFYCREPSVIATRGNDPVRQQPQQESWLPGAWSVRISVLAMYAPRVWFALKQCWVGGRRMKERIGRHLPHHHISACWKGLGFTAETQIQCEAK